MAVLSTLLSGLQVTVLGAVGAATVVLFYTVYRYRTNSRNGAYHKPSLHRYSQSVVVDQKKLLRCSVIPAKYSESRKLKTAKDIFLHAKKYSCKRPCFGRRLDFDSPPEWTTYEEVFKKIQYVGSALRYLSKDDDSSNVCIGICGRNSPEWIYTQHACENYGLVVVPLYDTLGNEALKHIMKQTEVCIVVCDTTEKARSLLRHSVSSLKHVVICQNNEPEDLEMLRSEANRASIMSFEELVELGKSHFLSGKNVQPTDLCMICYTSGSTGIPKGVIFTHEQFMNNVLRTNEVFEDLLTNEEVETHLSYLPLSHIMEQLIINVLFLHGSKVAFLTRDIKGLTRDMAFYRPTILCTVPRILTRMYTETMAELSGSITKWLFNQAIRQKLNEQERGIYKCHGILDSFYFKAIRTQVGNRVKVVICGSAPLLPEVVEFARAAFSCPLLEGYGSTESGGLVCQTLIGDQTSGHAGALSVGVKVKLADVPDMGFVASRDGVGEVCVFSDGITTGYFKEEAKTKELFDEDGFLRTGDVACWTENGALKIMDRCKNLFKLSQGEYIAPERVEQVYMSSPLVNNVYVDGNSMHSFTVAVVVPNWTEIRKRLPCLENQREESVSNETLAANELVRQLIFDDLTTIGKQQGLKGFEQVKFIHVASEPFTVENGLLTPTMKISRPAVRRCFAQITANFYASLG